MKPAGKAFHLPLALVHVKDDSLLLPAAIHLAEMLETDEVHLTVPVLLFAHLDANIEFKFYFHLLLKHRKQLLKNIIQTAIWYSEFGKSENETL